METRLPRLCVSHLQLGLHEVCLLKWADECWNLVSFCNTCQRYCRCTVCTRVQSLTAVNISQPPLVFASCLFSLYCATCFTVWLGSSTVCICTECVLVRVFGPAERKFPAPGSSSCPQEFPVWADGASWINVVVVVCVRVCAHILTGHHLLFWKGNCSCLPDPFLPVWNKTHMVFWTCKHAFNNVSTGILKLDQASQIMFYT